MAKITQTEIMDACLNGIKKSFNEYYEWSGGDFLWNAPEYLLTVNIAKELSKIKKGKFITLEDNVKNTLKIANPSIRGPIPKKARPDGRSDIVLWWANGYPRGIIEVKNWISNFTHYIKEDIDRIITVLNKDSTLEFGICTFYIDNHYEKGDAKKKLFKKIENIIKEIKEYIEKSSLILDWNYKLIYEEKEDKDIAYSVCVMIKK
jgi:hypothetical protein